MTTVTSRLAGEVRAAFMWRHEIDTLEALPTSDKLSSMVVVDDVKYGPIVDVRDPGESDEDFLSRHMVHVARWVNTNYPEGNWTLTETTWVTN